MNKLEQVFPIDETWAVSPRFAGYAARALEALDPVKSDERQHIYQQRLAEDGDPKSEWLQARGFLDDSYDSEKPYAMIGSTAVLCISGPMTKKPTSAQWLFGGTSTIVLRQELRAAIADADVERIVMHVESPGGQVDGLAELGDDLIAAAAEKPLLCYIEDDGASAAYYEACHCDEIWMNQMGWAGCIGTVCGPIVDSSDAAKKAGFKVYAPSTGKYKGMLMPGMKVTKDQLDHIQHIVEVHGEDFFTRVARGRGLDLEAVRKIADGRMYSADECLELGLVDQIGSFEEFMEHVNGKAPKSPALNPEPGDDPDPDDPTNRIAARGGDASQEASQQNDKAKALRAEAEEKRMAQKEKPSLRERLNAFFGKAEPKALEEAGIDPGEMDEARKLFATEASDATSTVTATPAAAPRQETVAATLGNTVSPEIEAKLAELTTEQAALRQRLDAQNQGTLRAAAQAFAKKYTTSQSPKVGPKVMPNDENRKDLSDLYIMAANADGENGKAKFTESGEVVEGANVARVKAHYERLDPLPHFAEAIADNLEAPRDDLGGGKVEKELMSDVLAGTSAGRAFKNRKSKTGANGNADVADKLATAIREALDGGGN